MPVGIYKRKPHTEEWEKSRKGICLNTGRTHFKKGDKTNLGRKRSLEFKEKIRQANFRRQASGNFYGFQKGRGLINGAHTGHKHTEESKKKMSLKLKGRVMSEEARIKMGIARTGSKNWAWKGGVTPANVKARNSAESEQWRKRCFKRDNWTDQKDWY